MPYGAGRWPQKKNNDIAVQQCGRRQRFIGLSCFFATGGNGIILLVLLFASMFCDGGWIDKLSSLSAGVCAGRAVRRTVGCLHHCDVHTTLHPTPVRPLFAARPSVSALTSIPVCRGGGGV